jgi:hypothetical protein
MLISGLGIYTSASSQPSESDIRHASHCAGSTG